jgi:hypothetical protein
MNQIIVQNEKPQDKAATSTQGNVSTTRRNYITGKRQWECSVCQKSWFGNGDRCFGCGREGRRVTDNIPFEQAVSELYY